MEWLIQHPDGSNRDFFEWKNSDRYVPTKNTVTFDYIGLMEEIWRTS